MLTGSGDSGVNKVLSQNKLDGIWYKNGRPDFTPVSLFNVKIDNMSADRTGSKGNFYQARKKMAEEIIKHNGNINSMMKSGVISEYASNNTKKTLHKFLKNYAKDTLESNLTYDEKVISISKKIKTTLQSEINGSYTIHEVNMTDVQLVPTEINDRFQHDGGVHDCKSKGRMHP